VERDRQWIFASPLDPHSGGRVIVHSLNLIVIRTHDIERSRRFYEAIGLRFQPFQYGYGAESIHGPVPADAPLILDVKAEGMPPPHTYIEIHTLRQEEPIPKLQIGFFVNDVDAAVKAALESGGHLLSKAATWPYGRRAAVGDPDGHRVELSEDPFGRLTGDYPT
jgi:catechol 2,3-dioxygenase-like lactoylglutathione lyase family enzyme